MCEDGAHGCPRAEADWSWLPLLVNYTPGERNSWIIVREENKSQYAEMVNETGRASVVLFGGMLSACSVLLNLFLCWLLSRRRPHSLPAAVAFPARPLLINSSLAQLALGAFVIPLQVVTEKVGRWALGPVMCRCWLSAQVLLVALTVWSLFVITLDRFVYVVQPLAYSRRFGRRSTIGAIAFSWLVSFATLIPMIVALDQPEFLHEGMCAVSMTRQHAFTLSFAVFLGPALLTLIAVLAVVIAAVQAKIQQRMLRKQALGGPLNDDDDEEATRTLCSDGRRSGHGRCCCCPDISFVTYSEFVHVGGVASAVVASVLVSIGLWTPFYVTNVLIPFCNGLCVNPDMWSLFVWLGYSNAGISPVVWLLDPDVRAQLKDLLSRPRQKRRDSTRKGSNTMPVTL
ncbi:hypothetical protein CAPTEDRAFT_188563 [Capitella teleta]|uniref:G-protein coupled receptors family 1 profile domain-containing protein n=1 Tax=Capitella teleta TaxID=283909 RepID=R7UQ23_CAPTE|nr:hypothetical protein CAPTEDRAFT_188563 [Capitella teleta]|eukprot:ELU06037.1 hypothetical protein CAPTEDRAFT_188563 [Capitella teleta]